MGKRVKEETRINNTDRSTWSDTFCTCANNVLCPYCEVFYRTEEPVDIQTHNWSDMQYKIKYIYDPKNIRQLVLIVTFCLGIGAVIGSNYPDWPDQLIRWLFL
jgi:hypothetical protein